RTPGSCSWPCGFLSDVFHIGGQPALHLLEGRMFFRKRRESAWLGAGAGVIGGLAGSYAVGAFLHLWAKKKRSAVELKGTKATERAADRLARKIAGHGLDQPTKLKAASAIHFAFGSLMGAAYGAATVANRKVGAAAGLPFGATVYAGAHATLA